MKNLTLLYGHVFSYVNLKLIEKLKVKFYNTLVYRFGGG
jgi:hypothetical protein